MIHIVSWLAVVLAVVFSSMLFFGCSEPADVSSQTDQFQERTRSRSRYPTGVDTVAAWSNGRYQIVVDGLYDDENNTDPCILRLVRAYLQQGSYVYVRGKNECVVLDLENLKFERFPIAQIPSKYMSVFDILQKGSDDNRVHVLPIINP